MAQHVPIQSFTQKAFKKIGEAIHNDFTRSRGLMKTSMKYNFDSLKSSFLAEDEQDEVYMANRRIPKGIVFGSQRGYFEVHYNREKGKVTNIYLVA